MPVNTISDLRDLISGDITTIEKELSARSLVSHNYVLRLSQGLYVVSAEGGAKAAAASVTRCSRWTEKEARRIEATCGIRDGLGNMARAVPLREALQTELDALRSYLDVLPVGDSADWVGDTVAAMAQREARGARERHEATAGKGGSVNG